MNAKRKGIARVQGGWVHYYLVTEEANDGVEYGLSLRYGTEEVTVPKLGLAGEEVCALLKTMLRGKVTPVAVWDVVEDWLCR